MNRRKFLAGVGASAVAAIGVTGQMSAQSGSDGLETNDNGLVVPGAPINDPIAPEDVDPNSEQDITQFVARLVKETTPIEKQLVDDLDSEQYREVVLALEDVEVEEVTTEEPIPVTINGTSATETAQNSTTEAAQNNSSSVGGIPSKGNLQYSVDPPSELFALDSNLSAITYCDSYRNAVRGRSGLNRRIVLFVFYHRANWCWNGGRLTRRRSASASGHGNVYTWKYGGVVDSFSTFSRKGYYTKKVGRFNYCYSPKGNNVCIKENARNATSHISAYPGGRVSHRP